MYELAFGTGMRDLLADLTAAERRSLYALLGRAKAAVRLSGENNR